MSLTLLASNNASTVLASSINASATTLTVNTGTGALFPSPVSGASFFKLTLIDAATGQLTEIVHVTARTGDVMTIERAQEGTAARAWSANDIAANMLTAGTMQLYAQKDQALLIANNLSEIAAGGPAAVAATLSNLDLGDANGYVGRKIAEQWITSSKTVTLNPLTKRIKVTLTGGGGGGGGRSVVGHPAITSRVAAVQRGQLVSNGSMWLISQTGHLLLALAAQRQLKGRFDIQWHCCSGRRSICCINCFCLRRYRSSRNWSGR
ncbi:hypothetical protein CEW81_06090 [Kluyvera genomosp. 3]|uniref:Uncharacterized protein n=1 Tax=Kluyvera genomosp. 3 TaxID=2774055 RepID=A0A248KH57_9ENTR|nr:hypothetical protein CEW81_06090 [Kluyvera genomosp. 3]